MNPLVSVVIVSFNTREVTCECLASIFEQTRMAPFEVIVVDNGSADGSAAAIKERFPRCRVFEMAENLGFAAGQNAGILRSTGDLVLILNSDVIVQGDAISIMASGLKDRPRVGIVGPLVRQRGGDLAPSARRAQLGTAMRVLGIVNRHFPFKRYLPETAMRRYAGKVLGRLHDNFHPHSKRANADYVDGMCAMVRRSVLEEVGLFDEQFFFDYEIIDLCNRIRARGWEVEFDPASEVIHIGHVSRKTFSRILVETVRSELTYFALHHPDQLQTVRRANVITAEAKVGLLRLKGALGLGGDELSGQLDMLRRIAGLSRSFDAEASRTNRRIPLMPRREPSPEDAHRR